MTQRFRVPILGAACMSFVLFFVMQLLVGFAPTGPIDPVDPPRLVLSEKPREPELSDVIEPPEWVPPEQAPTDPEPLVLAPIDGPKVPTGSAFQGKAPVDPEPVSQGSSGLIALMVVQPDYPARCLERGEEGYVILEFTVTSYGRVKDARAIESDGCSGMERAAIRAIERSRFKASFVNGEFVESRGQRYKYSFTIDDEAGR